MKTTQRGVLGTGLGGKGNGTEGKVEAALSIYHRFAGFGRVCVGSAENCLEVSGRRRRVASLGFFCVRVHWRVSQVGYHSLSCCLSSLARETADLILLLTLDYLTQAQCVTFRPVCL